MKFIIALIAALAAFTITSHAVEVEDPKKPSFSIEQVSAQEGTPLDLAIQIAQLPQGAEVKQSVAVRAASVGYRTTVTTSLGVYVITLYSSSDDGKNLAVRIDLEGDRSIIDFKGDGKIDSVQSPEGLLGGDELAPLYSQGKPGVQEASPELRGWAQKYTQAVSDLEEFLFLQKYKGKKGGNVKAFKYNAYGQPTRILGKTPQGGIYRITARYGLGGDLAFESREIIAKSDDLTEGLNGLNVHIESRR